MSIFKYVGDEPRTFPDWSLEVNPGDEVEFDDNPDTRCFVPVASKHIEQSPVVEES